MFEHESFTFYLCIVPLYAFVFIMLFAPIFAQSTEPAENLKTWNEYYLFIYLFFLVWKTGTRPILTHHNGQLQFGLNRILKYDHPYATPELQHCATGAHKVYVYGPDIPVGSVDCTLITPRKIFHTHLLWGNNATRFLQLNPFTQYQFSFTWLDRGGVDSKLA